MTCAFPRQQQGVPPGTSTARVWGDTLSLRLATLSYMASCSAAPTSRRSCPFCVLLSPITVKSRFAPVTATYEACVRTPGHPYPGIRTRSRSPPCDVRTVGQCPWPCCVAPARPAQCAMLRACFPVRRTRTDRLPGIRRPADTDAARKSRSPAGSGRTGRGSRSCGPTPPVRRRRARRCGQPPGLCRPECGSCAAPGSAGQLDTDVELGPSAVRPQPFA